MDFNLNESEPVSLNRFFLLFLRFAVAAVFLFAAIGKALDYTAFQKSLIQYEWVPDAWLLPVGDILLTSEFAIAALLMAGRAVRPVAAVGGLLSTFFFFITLDRINSEVSESCSCFGVFLKLAPTTQIAVDAALIISCYLIYDMAKRARCIGKPQSVNKLSYAKGRVDAN